MFKAIVSTLIEEFTRWEWEWEWKKDHMARMPKNPILESDHRNGVTNRLESVANATDVREVLLG